MTVITTPWNGGSFWVPDQDEYLAMMQKARAAQDRATARSVKWESQTQPNTVAGGLFTGAIPDSGYIANLKLVSVLLSASATVQAFIATGPPGTGSTFTRLISNFGIAATSQITTWSSSQVFLRPTEGLYLLPSTGTITSWFVTYEQSVAEMQAKIYD